MRLLVIFPGPEPMWRDGAELTRRRLPTLDISFATGHREAEPLIDQAEAVISFSLSPSLAQKAVNLKWVQAMGSGLDGLRNAGLPADVILTGVPGQNSQAVAEAALGLMFALARDIPQLVRNQQRKLWAPSVSRLLTGKTVGIVGVGAIAEAMAVKCAALGMTVEGVTGTPRPLLGFDRMHPRSELAAVAGRFDVMVLLAALTPETHGLVGAEVLASMKPEAMLINVGRGGLVDEPALIDALQRGEIAAAGLDVFAKEPLPENSALWDMPNVLVSPHNAGRRDGYLADVLDTFESNLGPYLAGRPQDMPTRL